MGREEPFEEEKKMMNVHQSQATILKTPLNVDTNQMKSTMGLS